MTEKPTDDTEYPDHVDPDVPEADALEQARDWGGSAHRPDPKIPIDVNEADALDQAQEAWTEDEEDDPR